MKLGEIKSERAVEVIADLIAPIVNIASDFPDFAAFRTEMQEGETDREAVVRVFKEKVPELLKSHKGDVLDILCTINGMSREDLSVMDIIKGVIDLANDPDFMSLFLSAVNTGDRKQPSGS